MGSEAFTNLRNHVPIGMLVTEETFLPDQSAELLGYWYYRERKLPETREERQAILAIG